MSDPQHVKASEFGLVRVYDVTLPEPDNDAEWDPKSPAGAQRISAALGVADLNPDHVEFFDVATLGDLGLTGYMHDGLGIPRDALADKHAALENVAGHVLIVLSRAFDGREVHLSPGAGLSFVGRFAEDRPPVKFDPLPAGGAEDAPAILRVRAPRPQRTAFGALSLLVVPVVLVLLYLVLR